MKWVGLYKISRDDASIPSGLQVSLHLFLFRRSGSHHRSYFAIRPNRVTQHSPRVVHTSFNGNMKTRPNFSNKERESVAFQNAAKRYEDYVESSEADPRANIPPKLLNIRTGSIEPGGMGKRYGIASYIYYPERIAKDPFDSSYDVKSWKW